MGHPNIVGMKDIWLDDESGDVVIAFEFLEHDLSGIINDCSVEMNESIVKSIAKQLLQAVDYIHSQNIMHRDIKSSNILLSRDGSLKLADFGLARRNDNDCGYSCDVVTRWYRAPEVLLGDKYYGFGIDMWSVGCILAELMFKTPLFPGENEEDQLDRIYNLLGTPDYENWSEATRLPNWKTPLFSSYSQLASHCEQFGSNPVVDLLQQLLCLNPAKRISARDALKHPWFTQAPLPDISAISLPEVSRNEAWVRRIIEENAIREAELKRKHAETQQPYKKRKHSALTTPTASQPDCDVGYPLTKKRRLRV